MKKIIIASITALTLSASAGSFASVNQDEVAYLFGTQEAVEIQFISNAEMQTTEGQLFGISNDMLKGYLNAAYLYIKPIALDYANQLKDKAIAYLQGRLDGFLNGNNVIIDPIEIGTPLPPVVEPIEPVAPVAPIAPTI